MTTLYVNPTHGNDSASGNQSDPFQTITQALTQAQPGTTIQLTPGTYSPESGEAFPLFIPSGVRVLGNESNKGSNILIQGSGKFVSPSAAGQNITLLLADRAELHGVTVTNPETRGTGVWIESTSPIVTNCTFTNCKREGIFVTGNANPTIVENVLVSNAAYGLAVAGTASGDIQSNRFENTGYGIGIQDHAAPVISNNGIYQNRSGIVISEAAQPILRQNAVEQNSNGGVIVTRNATPDLGNDTDPGGNRFDQNGPFDLQNASSATVNAVGNQLDPERVQGKVYIG
ncbi:MAG: DUF1565 domain-containing protein [Actinomycetota bacterium]